MPSRNLCQLLSAHIQSLARCSFLDESAFSAAAGGERRARKGARSMGIDWGRPALGVAGSRLKAGRTATYAPQVSADLAREHRTLLGVSRLCTLPIARARLATLIVAICISRPICSIASTFPAYSALTVYIAPRACPPQQIAR